MSYADWEYQDFAELKKYEIRANVKCIAQNKVTTCFGEIKHKYLYIEFISTRSIKYNHAWRKIKKGMYQLSPLPVSLQHQPFAVLLKQDVLHPENYYKVYGCLKFRSSVSILTQTDNNIWWDCTPLDNLYQLGTPKSCAWSSRKKLNGRCTS